MLSLLFDDRSKIASVIRFLIFAALSWTFASAASDAFLDYDTLTGVVLVGLGFVATSFAGSEIIHLARWNNRDVTVDEEGVYVAGIELSVPWHALIDADHDPAGLVLRTTLARSDWVIPAKDPEAVIKRIRDHPRFRQLDPYVNVN
jgi:hypothetical protein